MLRDIWIPNWLYAFWPALVAMMAIGFLLIGCHVSGLILATYAAALIYRRL